MLTDEDLDAIEARAQMAREAGILVDLQAIDSMMRADIPALVAEVRRLRRVVRQHRTRVDREIDAEARRNGWTDKPGGARREYYVDRFAYGQLEVLDEVLDDVLADIRACGAGMTRAG